MSANVANDVDSFAMLDESLRRWVHAHSARFMPIVWMQTSL